MSSLHLYEIETVLRDAEEAAEQYVNAETGEIAEDWAAFLDDVQMERDAKALAVAARVRELKAEGEAVSLERKRLQAREKSLATKHDQLKTYLQQCLKVGEKLKDTRVSISWSHRQSVSVSNPEVVPDIYCKIERTPMATAIKAAIEGGIQVPGATVITNDFITIR